MVSIAFVRKLKLLHKQVGGYLISYSLQLACVRKLEVFDEMNAHCRIDRSELIIRNGRVSERVNNKYRKRAARAAKKVLANFNQQCSL